MTISGTGGNNGAPPLLTPPGTGAPTHAAPPPPAGSQNAAGGALAGLVEMTPPPRPKLEAGESSNSNRITLPSPLSQSMREPMLDPQSERSDSEHFSMSSTARLGLPSLRFDDDVAINTTRSRSSSASSIIEVSIPIPNEAQLGAQLREIFAPHMNEANAAAFESLIEDRSRRLHEMGETPETVAAVLSKGSKLDYAAQAAIGVVRSVPFAIASRAFDVVPALTSFVRTPAQAGAVVGAGSGAMDTVGGAILKNATSDVTWMTAGRDQLAPVMAEAKDAVQPSGARLAAEVSGAFQTYSARNVIRTVVAPLAEHAYGAKDATNIDSWIAAAGGPVAGGAAYVAMEYMNQSNHRAGPEFLLGRNDWEAQFLALKNSGPLDVAKSVGTRLAGLPMDVVNETAAGVRDLFTGTNLIKNGAMLAGGFAGVQAAKAAVVAHAEPHHGASAVAAIKQATNTVLSAPVFAGWTTADVMAGPALDQAKQRIQGVADSVRAAGSQNPTPHVAIQID